MEDFWSAFTSWFKEKTNSPLYFTYFIFVTLWNWQFLYFLFIEDESLSLFARVAYTEKLYWNPFVFEAFNWLLNLSWHFLPPVIFTIGAVLYLPKVNSWAHKIYVSNYFDRKREFDSQNLSYETSKTKALKQTAQERATQKKEQRKIERTLTQEEKWSEESLRLFNNQKNIEAMKVAYKAIYSTNGLFSGSSQYLGSSKTYIPPDLLSRLDSLEIVKISTPDSRIEFTQKGKFFLKSLQDQNLI